MRLRVDTRTGWASFDASDEVKAWEMYRDGGLRIRLTDDLQDEGGTVLAGVPLGVDLEHWEAA